MQPLFINSLASSPFNSFCVAQGKAISHLIDHGRFPSKKSQLKCSAYSFMRPLLIFFNSFTKDNFLISIPSLSKIKPEESERVTTFAPNCIAFSQAYCATFQS